MIVKARRRFDCSLYREERGRNICGHTAPKATLDNEQNILHPSKMGRSHKSSCPLSSGGKTPRQIALSSL
jgi:hypothetical protein